MLVKIDGFSPFSFVVFLARTNRVDVLEKGLARLGRFDRKVIVHEPNVTRHKYMHLVNVKGMKLEDEAENC